MPTRAGILATEVEDSSPAVGELALFVLLVLASLVAVAAVAFVLARAYARHRQATMQKKMPTTRRDAPPRKR